MGQTAKRSASRGRVRAWVDTCHNHATANVCSDVPTAQSCHSVFGQFAPIPAAPKGLAGTSKQPFSCWVSRGWGWVAPCPWHPGFPPSAIRSQSGSSTTFPRFGARRPERADASNFSLKIPKADGRLAPRTSTIGTGCCSAQPVLSSVVPVRPLSAIGWLAVLCGAPWRQPRNPPRDVGPEILVLDPKLLSKHRLLVPHDKRVEGEPHQHTVRKKALVAEQGRLA